MVSGAALVAVRCVDLMGDYFEISTKGDAEELIENVEAEKGDMTMGNEEKKFEVRIAARQSMDITKYVQMTEKDFLAYEQIVEAGNDRKLSSEAMDKEINKISEKYGFGDCMDDYSPVELIPEEITFEKTGKE